jgi:hypothetical protein
MKKEHIWEGVTDVTLTDTWLNSFWRQGLMSWLAVRVQSSLGGEAGSWLEPAPPVFILSLTRMSLNLIYWNQEQCASCNPLVLLPYHILLCCNTVQLCRWTLVFQENLVFVSSEFILKMEATDSSETLVYVSSSCQKEACSSVVG